MRLADAPPCTPLRLVVSASGVMDRDAPGCDAALPGGRHTVYDILFTDNDRQLLEPLEPLKKEPDYGRAQTKNVKSAAR